MGNTFRPLNGTDTPLAIASLNSLPSGGFAGSAAVDNATTLAEDALVSVTIATGATAGYYPNPATGLGIDPATGLGDGFAHFCTVYAYGSTDGTNYTDGMTGTDAVQTPPTTPNLVPIGVMMTPAASATYRGGPYSVAGAFGGLLPRKWGIVVKNGTAGPLAASGHSAKFSPFNESIP